MDKIYFFLSGKDWATLRLFKAVYETLDDNIDVSGGREIGDGQPARVLHNGPG